MPVTKKECAIDGCNRSVYARGWCKTHYWRYLKHGDPLAGKTFRGIALEWLEKHKDFPGDECLTWPFARSRGYGCICIDGKTARVSRLMCEHRHGPPPSPQHEAAHNCGKGHLGCVNGSHLRWATPKENHADKLLHGTTQRGERNGTAKLTEADVLAIRAISGISQSKIAERYGVDQMQISNIMRRKSWAWL